MFLLFLIFFFVFFFVCSFYRLLERVNKCFVKVCFQYVNFKLYNIIIIVINFIHKLIPIIITLYIINLTNGMYLDSL